VVAALLVTIAVSLAAAPSAGAKSGPVIDNFWVALWSAVLAPNTSPAGANNWDCKPTAAHPRPVVLLHGTYVNMFSTFANTAMPLKKAGYCVFALNYGSYKYGLGKFPAIKGLARVRSSSLQVKAFVDKVLAQTGATQVDIVGYSQGSPLARAYMKYDGGANAADPSLNKVHTLVGIAGANHGSTILALAGILNYFGYTKRAYDTLGPSARDLRLNSAFLTDLNAGSETMPGVSYTMIGTVGDEVSVPYTDAFLTAGPGATVNNVTLQNGCVTDLSDHFTAPFDARVHGLVLKALDPSYAGKIPCPVRVPGV
jgi:triacylglycerol esterase/lipase EstA (alpha/beta hydrolase family)